MDATTEAPTQASPEPQECVRMSTTSDPSILTSGFKSLNDDIAFDGEVLSQIDRNILPVPSQAAKPRAYVVHAKFSPYS